MLPMKEPYWATDTIMVDFIPVFDHLQIGIIGMHSADYQIRHVFIQDSLDINGVDQMT